MRSERLGVREASRRERGGTAGRDAYRHDNATMPQEWGAYQFPELRRAPGIVLDETIRDGLAKVLLKAVGERALRLLELWSGEGEPVLIDTNDSERVHCSKFYLMFKFLIRIISSKC